MDEFNLDGVTCRKITHAAVALAALAAHPLQCLRASAYNWDACERWVITAPVGTLFAFALPSSTDWWVVGERFHLSYKALNILALLDTMRREGRL